MIKPFKGNVPVAATDHEDQKAYDYNMPIGTPLYAVGDGVIAFVRSIQPDTGGGDKSQGNIVMLHTAWGGKDISVGYLHMQRNSATVKPGDTVTEGQLIGRSGNSGKSTRPHLHIFAAYGHWPCNSYGDCFKTDKPISPVTSIWEGDPAPDGENANTGNASDPSSTAAGNSVTQEQLYLKGSFDKVQQILDPANLKSGVEFNPPLPVAYLESGFSNGRPWKSSNPHGYIVRDPLFGGIPATAAPGPLGVGTGVLDGKGSGVDLGTGTAPPPAGVNAVVGSGTTPPKGADSAPTAPADPNNKGDQWMTFGNKYGLRFHYNPEEFSEAYSSSYAVDPIRFALDLVDVSAPVGITGGTISFSLLLNRTADVHLLNTGKDVSRFYSEPLTDLQKEELKTKGTLCDIEYLVRICNGDPVQLWSGKSSNWGLLVPTMVIISLGDGTNREFPRRLRGQLTEISVNHKQFYPGMIPTRTEVSLSIARISDGYFQPSETGSSPTGDSAGVGASVMPFTDPQAKQKKEQEQLNKYLDPTNATKK